MGDSSLQHRTLLEAALSQVKVKEKFHEGVRVTQINQSGKASVQYLTLSIDKFQLFITSKPLKEGKITSKLIGNKKPLIARIRKISSGSVTSEKDEGRRKDDDKIIDISSIDRIQPGQNTMQFEQYRLDLLGRSPTKSPKASAMLKVQNTNAEQYLSLSIIYNGDRSLAIMTHSKSELNLIVPTLNKLIKAYKKAKKYVGKDALLLRYIWIDVDKDQSNHLRLQELDSLLNRINFFVKKSELSNIYNTFCRKIGLLEKKKKDRGLNFRQCVTFFHMIRRDVWVVKPIDRIWNELFGDNRSNGDRRVKVNADMFLQNFLHSKQKEYDTTVESVKKLFSNLNKLQIADLASNILDGEDRYIDKNRFEEYLNSKENDIFDPKKEDFNPETMNQPLSHYWISSSHNTYLLGDQLLSQSSVEMYLIALHRGCRCVEIDIWDGPSDPRPVPLVKHGHSLTSSIPFADVIEAIDFFLRNNPESSPIIISLEIQCSKPYQKVMANQLRRTFGRSLFIPTHQELFEELPSPQSMKGKIILKGHRGDIEEDVEYLDHRTEISDDTQALKSEFEPSARVKICPDLSELVFFHGSKFKDLSQSKDHPSFQMHSFSDKRFTKLCSRNTRDWIKYNQTHMSRIFPEGIRVLSYNFNPIVGWSAGCQLIALNFQTSDLDLRLNDGLFRTNGNCGYVLKPQNMLQDVFIESFSAPISLEIQVFSASRLPKPRGRKRGECIDPYVQVTLWDVNRQDGKEIKKSYYTDVKKNNGFFPIFNSESSVFHFTVQNQNVAIVQFSVWDCDNAKSDEFIGGAAIPVSCIRSGYRSVQLFDANNTVSGAFDFANLLVGVEMERTIAEI